MRPLAFDEFNQCGMERIRASDLVSEPIGPPAERVELLLPSADRVSPILSDDCVKHLRGRWGREQPPTDDVRKVSTRGRGDGATVPGELALQFGAKSLSEVGHGDYVNVRRDHHDNHRSMVNLGAASPPPDQWLYDGSEKPSSFPSEPEWDQWGRGETAVNWH